MANTARTILRNRLRRHPDQLLISQDLEALGASNISELKLADLTAIAKRYGIEASAAEVAAFENAKAQGADFDRAMAAADNIGAATLPKLAGAAAVAFPGQDETDEAEDDQDANQDEAPALALDVSQDKEAEAVQEAKALTAETLKLLGAGDFLGFNAKLNDIALRACRPDPEPITIEIPSGPVQEGAVPFAKRQGTKDMVQAGLPQPLFGDVTKTKLAVYDAHDAPAKDKSYLWPDLSGAMLTQLARGRTVFIHGPAGTGKTSWAQQVAAHWGRSFVRISCDDQTEAATLVGMTVPDKEGGAKWQDGQLTAAIRRPGTVILIDEPSVARPGALFVLQAVLDADRKIHIAETGEVVRVAPDVVFVLADNTNGTGDVTGAYEATRRLNRAFLDRAGITVRFDYMGQQEEARALVARTGCDKKLAVELVRFAALTRQKAAKGDVSHPIGIRRLIALAELMTDGIGPDLAYQMAVIETAPFDDQEPLRQMFAADFKKAKTSGAAA